jgi:hypothetical protein
MRGACLEDCRDVDTGYQSKLSHRARSERGDERKPTIDDYADVRRRRRDRGDDTLEMNVWKSPALPFWKLNLSRTPAADVGPLKA